MRIVTQSEQSIIYNINIDHVFVESFILPSSADERLRPGNLTIFATFRNQKHLMALAAQDEWVHAGSKYTPPLNRNSLSGQST